MRDDRIALLGGTLDVALGPASMAQNDEMTTPIAPGVATPDHPNNSIGPLIFDNQTRSMLQIGQHPLSLSNLDPGVRTNSDGSVDVYSVRPPRRGGELDLDDIEPI